MSSKEMTFGDYASWLMLAMTGPIVAAAYLIRVGAF
ncbi:TPA_asm: membrane protein [Mycobacterium phage McProf]|nr:Uncharacterised protein [Mycobacteroides abscessus subsp. abscessus]VEG15681.1 Uncharacterised protein [Mycolicibacterium phlei]DAZ89996.1 TPA_asm: membrane protein [Mycobacterium phage McProf]DAZ90195.1 TPA_asm: membrane protein [Mycobacterium phage prophiFSIL01-1]SIA08910.1 Uncharacterised protein [Mycobacteroides abscessus subsp. abscessus]